MLYGTGGENRMPAPPRREEAVLKPSTILRPRTVPVVAALVLLAATLALRLGGSSHAAVSSHRAVSSTLHAFVHPDESIGLTFDDGSPVGTQGRAVPSLPPGTYTIRVTDDTTDHNFHLFGPGVEQTTDVGGMGSATWTVTFQAGGEYTYQCDVHADFMHGVFATTGTGSSGGSSSGGTSSGGTTSGGGSGSASSGGSTAAALRGTLSGTLSSAGVLNLSFQGKAVSKLTPGRYRITVVDRAAKQGFAVQRSGRSPITVSGVSFVGTHTVTVNLTPGKWAFFTSPGAAAKRSFSVVS